MRALPIDQTSLEKSVYLPAELSSGVSIVDIIRFIFLFIFNILLVGCQIFCPAQCLEANLIIFLQGTVIYGSLSPLV